MCRDVKYIILLYCSRRNTNTDATTVTTGNQIKQQQRRSVLIGCGVDREPSERKKKESKRTREWSRQVEPTGGANR